MPHKDFLKKFDALIKGVSDSPMRALLENLQKSLAYCLEEKNVLREVLLERYSKPWPQDKYGKTMEFQSLEELLKSYRRIATPFSGICAAQALPVLDLAA